VTGEKEVGDGDGAASLTCFVIGPIGNQHAPVGSDERLVYEDAIQVLEAVIQPACEAVGLSPVRADGLARAGEITEQVFRRLRDDDVVIADVTGANANVMYELGLRHTRSKLTVQIGEYGRLPFDLNVIRTVMFSRSRHGLVQARNDLNELLRAGLAGQYDAVAATRVWGEGADSALDEGSANGLESPASVDARVEEEPAGFLDLLAEGEAQQDVLNAGAVRIGERIVEMGKLADDAVSKSAQSDAQGRGMRGRLVVAVEYAQALSKVADDLEGDINEYVAALSAVSDANLALIERMEADPSQLAEAMDWALITRRLADSARTSMASLGGLLGSMEENAKLARVLREPTRRIAAALRRQSEATGVMDEWDRKLQALGVPVPPDDWEPTEVVSEAGAAEPQTPEA
jgi:hypothetical protein